MSLHLLTIFTGQGDIHELITTITTMKELLNSYKYLEHPVLGQPEEELQRLQFRCRPSTRAAERSTVQSWDHRTLELPSPGQTPDWSGCCLDFKLFMMFLSLDAVLFLFYF